MQTRFFATAVTSTARHEDTFMRCLALGCILVSVFGHDVAGQERNTDPRRLDFELVRTIDTKPFSGGAQGVVDSESLTYCPQDDSFWIADDDGNAVYQFARADGRFIMKVTAANLVAAFPKAGKCQTDQGTRRSYVNELETLACDPASGSIYLVNTVNNPKQNPPVDKQAIFKFHKADGAIVYDSWHPLPPGIHNTLDALIVIEGKLYAGGGKALVEYDYERQNYAQPDSRGNPTPVYVSQHGDILGLGFESDFLWVLTSRKTIVKVDWKCKQDVGVGDLRAVPGVRLGQPKGLEVVAGDLYVVDGDPPHKIFALRVK